MRVVFRKHKIQSMIRRFFYNLKCKIEEKKLLKKHEINKSPILTLLSALKAKKEKED